LNGEPVVLEHHHPFTHEDNGEIVLSLTPEVIESEVVTVDAEPRLIMIDGCRGAFVGKPTPAEYYTGLEQIRNRKILEK
jgi:hypothetical protein